MRVELEKKISPVKVIGPEVYHNLPGLAGARISLPQERGASESQHLSLPT